jgi:hypothetical protein
MCVPPATGVVCVPPTLRARVCRVCPPPRPYVEDLAEDAGEDVNTPGALNGVSAAQRRGGTPVGRVAFRFEGCPLVSPVS